MKMLSLFLFSFLFVSCNDGKQATKKTTQNAIIQDEKKFTTADATQTEKPTENKNTAIATPPETPVKEIIKKDAFVTLFGGGSQSELKILPLVNQVELSFITNLENCELMGKELKGPNGFISVPPSDVEKLKSVSISCTSGDGSSAKDEIPVNLVPKIKILKFTANDKETEIETLPSEAVHMVWQTEHAGSCQVQPFYKSADASTAKWSAPSGDEVSPNIVGNMFVTLVCIDTESNQIDQRSILVKLKKEEEVKEETEESNEVEVAPAPTPAVASAAAQEAPTIKNFTGNNIKTLNLSPKDQVEFRKKSDSFDHFRCSILH